MALKLQNFSIRVSMMKQPYAAVTRGDATMYSVFRTLLRRGTWLYLGLVITVLISFHGTAAALPDNFSVMLQRTFSGSITNVEQFGYLSNTNEIKTGSQISGSYIFAQDDNYANNWYFELKLELVGASGSYTSTTWHEAAGCDWGSLSLSPTTFYYTWNNGFGMGGLQDAYFKHIDLSNRSTDAGYLSLDVYDYIYKNFYGDGFVTFFDKNLNWNGSDGYNLPSFHDSWDDCPDDGYLSGVKLYFDIAPVPTPEPSTFILSAVGIMGFGLLGRRLRT